MLKYKTDNQSPIGGCCAVFLVLFFFKKLIFRIFLEGAVTLKEIKSVERL